MTEKATEIARKTGTPAVSQHVIDDARFELSSNKPADIAVATLDNGKAVKAMYPGDNDKQDAAYRIMMHNMKMPGYPTIEEADAKQFTAGQMKAISKYTDEYKSSANLKQVDSEAKELMKLGFPRPTMNGDDSNKSGSDAAGYSAPYGYKGGKSGY